MRFQKNQTAKFITKSITKTKAFVYTHVFNLCLKICMPLHIVKPKKKEDSDGKSFHRLLNCNF